MTPKQQAYKALGNTMIKNFKKRNIEAFYCEDSASAVALAMELMKDGGTVGKGGTETISEVGLLDAVKSAEHLTFIDREVAKTPEEKKQIYFQTLQCDYFLMSSNAVTLDGELVGRYYSYGEIPDKCSTWVHDIIGNPYKTAGGYWWNDKPIFYYTSIQITIFT